MFLRPSNNNQKKFFLLFHSDKRIRKLVLFTAGFFLIVVFLFPFLFTALHPVIADDCNQTCFDQLTKQIGDLNRALQSSIAATTPLEKNLDQLQTNLADIKQKIAAIETDVEQKQKEVDEGDKLLVLAQDLLGKKVRALYKTSSYFGGSGLFIFLNNNLSQSVREFGYQRKLMEDDRDAIIQVVLYVQDLEVKKKNLEEEKMSLAQVKEETDKQAATLQTVITGAKKYQADLTSQIAQLTARQQQILAQRLASLNIPLSAASMGRCDSDLTNGRDPGFSPKFAVFTYGVPNRVGLNQWGAYGRARAGQGYDQILHSYYNFDGYKDWDTNTKINVDGYGSYNLEDYVKRVYEVPNSWGDSGGMEALKAQAIAARSYALAYTNNGSGSICTSESCQVFQSQDKGGNWDAAVDATRGKVMIQGGNPIKAWFSSTHGGYVFSSGDVGWNNTSWTKNARDATGNVGSFSDLQNTSYDKDSPWFYCDWGSRSEYNKTAWLKPDELADIVNALMLVKRDSGTAEHLYQTDKPNPAGTDTWDTNRVKQELQSRGGSSYNTISDVSVSADFGSGRVTGVTVSGDAGSNTFDGSDFKNYFNLRAPANIQIVGPLYNIEKR